jgi:hypothetical protein
MDALEVLASGMIGSEEGGTRPKLLQFLEFCGRRESVSHLIGVLVIVVGVLDVSPDGDDTMWSWHH